MHHKPEHSLLLHWLILTGLIAFALIIAWHENLIQLLFAVDRSRISLAIALIYILVTLHCASRIIFVSNQHNLSQQVDKLVRSEDTFTLNIEDDVVKINQKTVLPDCMMTEYLCDIYYRNKGQKNEDNSGTSSDLIEVYESRLKGRQEIGWLVADVMLKLGLLGTIIGFIFMLGSLANIADFDVGTMQKILRHMSTGMFTALYTTLAGLICSILAAMQYHMIDRQTDELIEMTRHLAHVHVIPRMLQE